MNALRGMLLSGLLAAHSAAELPEWSSEELEALATGDLVPGAALLAPQSVDGSSPDAGWLDDLLESAEPLEPVPEEVLDDYFGQRPEDHLVDPQGLLDEAVRAEREEFLDYHASASRIDLFVYLFGADQGIPDAVRHRELAGRFFAEGKPAMIVCYYLGAPGRAEVQLSPSLATAVPEPEQRRLVQGATMAAQGTSDPVGQLEQFCVQSSIRLYWIEKEVGLDPSTSAPETAMPPSSAEAPSGNRELQDFLEAWGLPIASGAAAALVAFGLALTLRWRARFRFPEFDAAPRLGGEHAAGIGAVVGFGNTTQGPGRQPAEAPDCLGGI